MVRRDILIAQGETLLQCAAFAGDHRILAVAGKVPGTVDGRVRGGDNVAKDFVERAVFLDDHDDVLNGRGEFGRVRGFVETVQLENARGQFGIVSRVGDGVNGNGAATLIGD